jgi:ferredoxin-NADP reductase
MRLGARQVVTMRAALLPSFFFLYLTSAAASSSPLSSFASPAAVAAAAAAPSCQNPPEGYHAFKLVGKNFTTHDSCVLSFALPETLGTEHPFGLPESPGASYHTGVKLRHTTTDETGAEIEKDKSYSPISEPWSKTLDLLVKRYPAAPHGGFGSFLCSLEPGESATMAVKPAREVLGSVDVSTRRFKQVGMVAGGTGLAPFMQIIRTLLAGFDVPPLRVPPCLKGTGGANLGRVGDGFFEDPPADLTPPPVLSLLFVNREERDILMKSELDELKEQYPGALRVTYLLTQPGLSDGNGGAAVMEGADEGDEASGGGDDPSGAGGAGTTAAAAVDSVGAGSSSAGRWVGPTGRGSAALAKTALPDPGKDTLVMVCGSDGFVDSWAGAITRVTDPATGKKTKVQGPLRGILKEAGFTEDMVYKF